MKRALVSWWRSRSPAERRLIVAVALGAGLALHGWLLLSTVRARRQLIPAVVELQAQALRQNAQTDEIVKLRALPPPSASATDLRQLVQHQLDADGLGRSLVSNELVDAQHVKLVFGSVAFADWLAWADRMQAQHLRFAAVRIEAQPTRGQVSVTATLERPGR